MANMAGRQDGNEEWFVDSGCTEHLTHRPDLLENRKKTPHETPNIIPNGKAILVEEKGDYTLPGGVKLNGVLHVPNFNCNLLSVSRLSKDLQCAITFFPDFCVMQGLRTRNLIGAGRCKGGLYRMGMVDGNRRALMAPIDMWHKRLGHASKEKLSGVELLKSISFNHKNNICDSCAKAKFVRTPFSASSIKTNDCFELIHCDIWGSYRIPSYTRANYFLTIVDDFSRSVWVFLI